MKTSLASKVLFVLTVLFALMFINAGLDKFFHYMPMPKDMPDKMMKAFQAFMEIGWLMPLVGIAELIGGILIIFPRTRAVGALIILPVLVGIIFTNIVQDSRGLPIAAVLTIILAWIMYDNRQRYLPLLEPKNNG